MLRATVPEAAIHKHGNPLLSKHKVRSPCDGDMSPPADYSISPEKDGECNLGFLVALAAYPGHDLGTLVWRKNIRHFKSRLAPESAALCLLKDLHRLDGLFGGGRFFPSHSPETK